jgi:hypothetical protein
MTYAWLEDARIQQRANDTFDDDLMYRALFAVSSRIDSEMGKSYSKTFGHFFEPWVGENVIFVEAFRVNTIRNSLALDYPLLEFTSVQVNGSSVSSVGAGPVSGVSFPTPYRHLYLFDRSKTWYNANCASTDNIADYYAQINGAWGLRYNYANAWQGADTLTGDINSSVTTLTVTDADGVDYTQLSPRFSRGQLIRIDDEYMRIDAINTTANTLTVRREQNGTTAAAHSSGDSIEVFYPEEDLRNEVAAQAAAWYERRGAFETSTFDGFQLTEYPTDLLNRLLATLQNYLNLGFR